MELLRELIADKGMTFTEFAEDAKISPHTLDNWLNGRTIPRHNNLVVLAKYFGVPVERFEAAFDLKKRQVVTIETPVSELPADLNEKQITRAEYIRATKRSMEKLQEIIGDSKSAILAAEFLRADAERRLW